MQNKITNVNSPVTSFFQKKKKNEFYNSCIGMSPVAVTNTINDQVQTQKVI